VISLGFSISLNLSGGFIPGHPFFDRAFPPFNFLTSLHFVIKKIIQITAFKIFIVISSFGSVKLKNNLLF